MKKEIFTWKNVHLITFQPVLNKKNKWALLVNNNFLLYVGGLIEVLNMGLDLITPQETNFSDRIERYKRKD